jgi:hypothetical protein
MINITYTQFRSYYKNKKSQNIRKPDENLLALKNRIRPYIMYNFLTQCSVHLI